MPVQPDPDTRRGQPTRRPAGPRTKWVPVEELSPLARALLSEDLGGRDVVPAHVASRVTAQADEWSAHGFDAETLRPWQDMDPATAAYLVQRGVEPRVLDLPVAAFANAQPVPLRLAITTGRITVERAYELLVLTGEHQEPRPPALQSPVTPAAPRTAEPSKPAPKVTPVLFSHATIPTDDLP
ncbi:hypothetical protein [Micromonospora sp. CPCC 206061]|uniref:hypothetical protein n=1 Tax=Micromonospora sp. CPCC 206061 TaxID=3122410 RepID=UPI002FF182E7